MTVNSDVKKAREANFHMEDRGRLHCFLSLRIRGEEGKATIDQEQLIETMPERFHMDRCNPSRTPADLNLKFRTAQNGDDEMDQRIFRSLVGLLLYMSNRRSEISCSPTTLCPDTLMHPLINTGYAENNFCDIF